LTNDDAKEMMPAMTFTANTGLFTRAALPCCTASARALVVVNLHGVMAQISRGAPD
jgi:hypothetical protein